jgi:amino acid efflux transporter
VPGEAGVSGYAQLVYGEGASSAISFLFLATVTFGMPCASLISGQYIAQALGFNQVVAYFFSLSIPWLGFISNASGVKFGSRSQTVVTIGLVVIAVGIFATTLPSATASHVSLVAPLAISPLLLAVTAAFWAFAGFENISFMAGEFKNPGRDLFLSAIAALVICGAIYLGLAFCYAKLVPYSEINLSSGLLQLSAFSQWPLVTTKIVGVFAYVAVLLNFNSWMWGISRMIFAEATARNLPAYFSVVSGRDVPSRALMALALTFSVVLTALSIFKSALSFVLVLVSANFVIIYVICALTYVALNKSWSKRLSAILVGVILAAAIAQSGWTLLYPAMVITLALVKHRRLKTRQVSI